MEDNQRQDWWPDENSSASPQASSPDRQPHITADSAEAPAPGSMPYEGTNKINNPQTSDAEYRENPGQNQNNPYGWNSNPGQNRNNPYGWNSNPGQNQSNPYQTGNNWNSGYPSRRAGTNAMAVASLVMGILSLLLICCGASYCVGALGILFALLSRKEGPMESQASIGLGLSITGSIGGIVLLIYALVSNPTYVSDFLREYQKFYQEYENQNSDGFDLDDFNYGNFADDGYAYKAYNYDGFSDSSYNFPGFVQDTYDSTNTSSGITIQDSLL